MHSKQQNLWKRHEGMLVFIGLVVCILLLLFNHGKYSAPGLYGHLAIPGRFLIANFAKFVGGYGMGIILLTIIVRLCLMPAMIKQSKMMTIRQTVNKIYQPKIYALQHKIGQAKQKHDRQDYKDYEQQLMNLYKHHHLGLASMGCGTMLAQVPIFMMLYASIRFSPEVQHAYLFGVKLGLPSKPIAAVCFALYFVNACISWYIAKHGDSDLHESKQARKRDNQMSMLVFVTPFWIGSIAMSVSAGLALYFCVGGIFVICQQLYIQYKEPQYKTEGQKILNDSKKQ